MTERSHNSPSLDQQPQTDLATLPDPLEYGLASLRASVGSIFQRTLPSALGISPEKIVSFRVEVKVSKNNIAHTVGHFSVQRVAQHAFVAIDGGNKIDFTRGRDFEAWWNAKSYGSFGTPSDEMFSFLITHAELKKGALPSESPFLRGPAPATIEPTKAVFPGLGAQTSPGPTDREVVERLGLRQAESLFTHHFERRGIRIVCQNIVDVFQKFVGSSRLASGPVQLFLYARTAKEGLVRDANKKQLAPFVINFRETRTREGTFTRVWTSDERVCSVIGRPSITLAANKENMRVVEDAFTMALQKLLQNSGVNIPDIEYFLSSAGDLDLRDGTTEGIDTFFSSSNNKE